LRNLIQLVRELPLAVKVLLLAAMAQAVSYFALLAYLPIYLHDSLGMNGAVVGYTLGLCVLGGTFASVYGGYLADRFVKVYYVIVLDVVLIALYLALTIVKAPAAVVVLLLLVNSVSSSFGVTGNALISELVESETRTKVFSLRYSLQNIGAAIGPFLGVVIARSHPTGPFVLSAGVVLAALVPLALFQRRFLTPGSAEARKKEPLDFGAVLKVMGADRRLLLFTLGGILSIVVYGPLLTIMSQYLVITEPRETAYQLVAYISAVNAIVVIALQYAIGNRLKHETLLRWLTWGIAAFAVGLFALSLSSRAVPMVLAVTVFTIGEVIVVPAEYMFVDAIAPINLRGSYFGAQNLIRIGIALGPILCGFLLAHFAPAVMFYALIAIVALSWWFYALGCRAAAKAPARSGQVPPIEVSPEEAAR
jgi:MFS family permease